METKYIQTSPDGVFKVSVTRTMKRDAHKKMYYEYTFTIEARAIQSDFVNLFAELVARYGKRSASFYANMMGVDKLGFKTTLVTLTGAGICEWTDALAAEVAETLLRETTLSVGEIAVAAGWGRASGGHGIFSRWFARRYNCSPSEWRNANNVSDD